MHDPGQCRRFGTIKLTPFPARLPATVKICRSISPAEFARRCTLDYLMPLPLAVQREQARLGSMLNRLAVNLNQIARHMNAGRGAPAYLSALIARINAILDEIYGPDDHSWRNQL
jgi:hypothetical protein